MKNLKDIFDKIGYGDYGEFFISEEDEDYTNDYYNLQSIFYPGLRISSETARENRTDSFLFWAVILNPEFCKKVFGSDTKTTKGIDYEVDPSSASTDYITYDCIEYDDGNNWQPLEIKGSAWIIHQLKLFEMRNQNKSIDEVLEYISENTILKLN